jgi:hypothetical protein
MKFWTVTSESELAIGKALPYSIYGADRKLLLPAGQIIANAVVRDHLKTSGVYCSDEGMLTGSYDVKKFAIERRLSPTLLAFTHTYSDAKTRSQFGFKISSDEKSTGYSVSMIGMLDNGNSVMTAPLLADGSPVPVHAGQSWLFRAFYVTAALRFRADILHANAVPFPHLYIGPPQQMERQNIRRWPRVQLCKPVNPDGSGDVRYIMVDLSVGGVRLAAEARFPLQKGQRLTLPVNLPMLQTDYPLTLTAVVLNVYGSNDADHPDVAFYGLQFEKPTHLQLLTLHGFVQEQMCAEMDRVTQLLADAEKAPKPKT